MFAASRLNTFVHHILATYLAFCVGQQVFASYGCSIFLPFCNTFVATQLCRTCVQPICAAYCCSRFVQPMFASYFATYCCIIFCFAAYLLPHMLAAACCSKLFQQICAAHFDIILCVASFYIIYLQHVPAYVKPTNRRYI